MKKIYKELRNVGLAFLASMSFVSLSSAQFGCGSPVVITNGYTNMGITTPGIGGLEDWNDNPTGTSINESYWDDDVYLFEYTAGATAEQISMTIFTRNGWNGIGVFSSCTGVTFSGELDAAGSTGANVSKTVSAIISVGQTVYIAVGQWGTPDDLDFDVTDFTVTPLSCPDPSNFNIVNLTTTTAEFSWTEFGTATTWDVEYGAPGFTLGSGTQFSTTTNPHVLSGLSSDTDYEVYIQSNCGGGNFSGLSGPYAFRTLCTAFTAPFYEGFSTGIKPNCWDNLSSNTTSTSADNFWRFNKQGENGALANGKPIGTFANSDGSTPNPDSMMLVTPYIDISTLTVPTLSFEWFSNNTNNPANNVPLIIEVYDGTNWNDLDTLKGNNPLWQEVFYDLSAYAGGTIRIRFMTNQNGVTSAFQNDILLDEVRVGEAPSCMKPSALLASNLTATSADLAWTENGSAAEWQVEYGTAGFTQGSGTLEITGSNPHAITTMANADYGFYVRSICGVGDTSDWSGPYVFTTPCAVVTAPWMYDVESATATTNSTIEDCWSSSPSATTSDYRWNVEVNGGSTPSASTGPNAPYSGSSYFYVEASSGGVNDSAYLITPSIDLSSLTAPSLSFFYHMYGVDMNSLSVQVSSDNGVTWTTENTIVGQQQSSASDAWIEYFVDLQSYTGTVSIQFVAARGSSYFGDISIDNITVAEAPSCFAPTDLSTSNITATSAELAWTENNMATEWQVEFGAPGFGQGTGTIESATSNPHAITITPNTAYEFYVRSVCGVGDTSAWSGPYGFSNIYCIPVYTSSSDYTKSINSSGAVTNVTYSTASQPAGGYADETAQVIESYENQTFVINTEFVGGSNGIYIWVDWNNDYDFDNITELVASLQNSSATKTLSITVPTGVAVGDYRMRVRSRWSTSAVNPCETTSFGSAVDFTLSIGVAPSCLPTSNLIASGPTQTTVDLAWTENNSATTWNIEYGPVGFTPGTGTTISGVTTNPFTVTGLNPSSTYDFYVQSDCGGGDESAMGGFATESTACGVVTAPFYEGFNTGVQPVCWDNLSSNTTSTSINNFWKFTGSVEGGAVNNGKPNGTFAFSDGDTPKPDSMMLITPEIDLSALTTPSLGFEWFSNNTNNPGNNIPMIVSVFNGSTWTLLDTLVGDFAEWQFASYDLTPFANDTIRVRFMTNQTVITTTAWYNDILLDGVRIDNCLSGQNGSRDVCRLDSTINLNDNIVVGNHGGGTWTSPSLQPFIMNDSILNFSALPAGSHQIYYIERFACEESSIATINVFNTSSAGTGQSINVCKNEPINLYSALSGNVDLGGDWYDYTNALLPNSQPIAPNLSAQYNYFYIANNGVCPADTALVEVMVGNCVWSVDEELFTDISVYPNPATSLLNIVNPSNTASLKVEMLDMNGKVVLIENKALNNASEATIAIDHLERGFYTLRVYNNEGQRTFKIVKL